MKKPKVDINDEVCRHADAYAALVFTEAVKLGIDTDIAREMSKTCGTAWVAGYTYAKSH